MIVALGVYREFTFNEVSAVLVLVDLGVQVSIEPNQSGPSQYFISEPINERKHDLNGRMLNVVAKIEHGPKYL